MWAKMENENTYKYGAGSYQEQNLDIQREHERQARQREEDARRAHDEELRQMERNQQAQRQRRSQKNSQKTTPRKTQKQTVKKTANTTTAQSKAKPANAESLTPFIVIAGFIAGFYLTSVYIQPSEGWIIWAGMGAGGLLAYWLRSLIVTLVKIGLVAGAIYLVFAYVLPALSS